MICTLLYYCQRKEVGTKFLVTVRIEECGGGLHGISPTEIGSWAGFVTLKLYRKESSNFVTWCSRKEATRIFLYLTLIARFFYIRNKLSTFSRDVSWYFVKSRLRCSSNFLKMNQEFNVSINFLNLTFVTVYAK